MTKVRPLWLWIAIILLVVLLVIVTQKRTEEVHAAGNVPKLNDQFSVLVPSPYELDMLNKEKDIWPRRFGPKTPPASSDLPVIYSAYMQRHPQQRDEVDFFRTLAMTVSLGEWDNMRDILSFKINVKAESITPDRLLAWVKNEKCSTYGKELAYRLVQWDAKKLPEVKAIFEGCDPQSFHTLWLTLLMTLESKNKEAIAKLSASIQKRREFLPNDSFEYFVLTQAFDSMDLQLAHSK